SVESGTVKGIRLRLMSGAVWGHSPELLRGIYIAALNTLSRVALVPRLPQAWVECVLCVCVCVCVHFGSWPRCLCRVCECSSKAKRSETLNDIHTFFYTRLSCQSTPCLSQEIYIETQDKQVEDMSHT